MLIELKNIKKEYKSGSIITNALERVSFQVEEGEFVAITGPSGSGKSTLMHIIGFLDRPSAGIYKFKGRNINEFSDEELSKIRNKEIGFVFQSFNLLPKVSALDNVQLPLIYANVSKRERKELAKKSLKAVGLIEKINSFPNQLSGGEQQRVAIARAIVNNPSIILADEPTGNLDSKSGQIIMEIFQDLNKRGHTIILVTHESYTAKMASRIIQLKDGKVISDEFIKDRRLAKNGFIK